MSQKAEKRSDQLDAFQTKAMAGLDWLLAHRGALWAVLVPLVVVVVGAFAWTYLRSYHQSQRLTELGKIETVYSDEMKAADSQREALSKQLAALQAPTGKSASAADAAAIASKRAALEHEAEGIKADHSKSLPEYQAFFKAHEHDPEGWVAGMRAASILVEQKQFPEARDVLKVVVGNSEGYPLYQVQGRLTYINVLEQLKDYDQALKETDKLATLVGDDMKPQVLLTKGEIQILKNARADAKATLDEIVTKHASSPEATRAESMKALLN